ncbi:FMN-binding protein [Pseudoscardovia suis]|uniref:FMN-binding protein n=1 Tax=Pseudoscardovia suis TaxID=987063 RepID=UPI003F9B2FE0
MTSKTPMRKAVAALGAVIALGAPSLAGCGEPKAVPADDEYAGSEESSSGNGSDDSAGWKSAPSAASASGSEATTTDTGDYADGTYKSSATYGPVGEDSIDVSITVAASQVTDVQVVGHAFTSVSEGHQDDFIAAIGGVVKGKPLKDLSVDKVAGASWTSDAFNAALDVIRQEASAARTDASGTGE